MKVKDLIAKLSQLDPEADIRMVDGSEVLARAQKESPTPVRLDQWGYVHCDGCIIEKTKNACDCRGLPRWWPSNVVFV